MNAMILFLVITVLAFGEPHDTQQDIKRGANFKRASARVDDVGENLARLIRQATMTKFSFQIGQYAVLLSTPDRTTKRRACLPKPQCRCIHEEPSFEIYPRSSGNNSRPPVPRVKLSNQLCRGWKEPRLGIKRIFSFRTVIAQTSGRYVGFYHGKYRQSMSISHCYLHFKCPLLPARSRSDGMHRANFPCI